MTKVKIGFTKEDVEEVADSLYDDLAESLLREMNDNFNFKDEMDAEDFEVKVYKALYKKLKNPFEV